MSAPQPPASCASAQSARPATPRQAAGWAGSAVGSTTGLGATGLAGTLLLAIASHRSGGASVVLWLAGTLLLGGAWLALGRGLDRLTGRRLLATGLAWAAPLLASAPLASRDGYAYACQGQLVTHGIDPYTSGVASLPCPWLHSVPSLWWHTPTPYGPLWLILSGGAAAGSGGRLAVAVVLLRLVAIAGLVLAGWAGYQLAGTLRVDPVPAAWLGLLSPLVLVHAVSGVHNDALLAGLVLAALAVAARRSPGTVARAVLAGGLVGLAIAVKATALVTLPFVVLLVARDGRWMRLVRVAVATCLALAAGYAVVAVPSGYGLGWLPALSRTTSLIQWTSLPTGVGMTGGYLARVLGLPGLAPPLLSGARALGLLVLAAVLIILWLRARLRADQPRPVVAATGVALAATVLLAPVAFPWYALLPLAVLACATVTGRRRYRLGLVAAALALLVLPDGTGLAALTKVPGALLDTALVIALAVVALRRYAAGRATPRSTAR